MYVKAEVDPVKETEIGVHLSSNLIPPLPFGGQQRHLAFGMFNFPQRSPVLCVPVSQASIIIFKSGVVLE